MVLAYVALSLLLKDPYQYVLQVMKSIKTVKLVGHAPSGNSELKNSRSSGSRERRIFLLSPANASSSRSALLLGESGQSVLAERLRAGTASLGEIFSFISGLYFRGKLTYARAFANPPPGIPGIVVITPSGGLVSPDKLFTRDALREITAGAIDATDPRYRIPLERDAHLLSAHSGKQCEIVLLGSIATPKYVDPLVAIFGEKPDVSFRICRTRGHEPRRLALALCSGRIGIEIHRCGRRYTSRRTAC